MKAVNDVVRPKLPVFDEKATEEELLAFDEDEEPVAGAQQEAKPRQTAGVEKSVEALPNLEAAPPSTGIPDTRSHEHRPVDPRSSHWRNPFRHRDNWRVENRRAKIIARTREANKWALNHPGVEFLQRQYRCPWREVLRCFHILLKGRAREWYWLHVKRHQVEEWEALKRALIASFRGAQTEHDKMHELMQREQGRGESAVDFIHAIQKLASRLREPLPEARLIKIAKKGLRDDLARYVYALDVYTMDQLRDECSEVEKAFGRRNLRPAFDVKPPPRFGAPRGGMSANEIDVPIEDPEFPELEVEEARVLQRAQRRAGCWNCESTDHEFRNCMAKERKIFCYRCGRPDTFCPQCPDCAENWQRSATRAGESRPGMNPAKK
ncbi:hypothetical protein ACLKA6_008408 [Drosophila palustris]